MYIISHVGLIISLVCLVLAIATFLLCRAIHNHNTYLHLHLCVCLFLAKTLFLTGVDKTGNQVSHPSGCVLAQPHHLHICPSSSYPIISMLGPTAGPLHVLSPLMIILVPQFFTWFTHSCDRCQFKIISLVMLYIVVVSPIIL